MRAYISLNNIISSALAIWLFLLPWQTRHIYQPAFLNGGYYEYGTLSFYATELLGWGIVLLFAGQIIICNFQFSIFKQWKNSKLFKKIFLGILISVSILVFFITNSTNPEVSFQYVIRLLQALCMGVIIICHPEWSRSAMRDPLNSRINAKTRGSIIPRDDNGTANYKLQITNYLAALWLGGITQALLAIYQFFTQHISANKWLGLAVHNPSDLGAFVVEHSDERWLRAYGAFGSPNSLGIYLAVVLVIGLIWYLSLAEKKAKLLVNVGQLVILSGLLVSFSRGAWLAASAGLLSIFLILLLNKKIFSEPSSNFHSISKVLVPFVSYSLLTLSFLILFSPLIITRFNTANRLEQRSVSERQTQWHEAMPLLKLNWLLGVGPGAYTAALARVYPGRPAFAYQPIHNIYALALVEWGSLISVIFFAASAWVLKCLIKTTPMAAGVVATLLVAGLFDHWLVSLYTGLIVWIVALTLSRGLGEKKL